jgi:flagellar biosynthesis protein FliP
MIALSASSLGDGHHAAHLWSSAWTAAATPLPDAVAGVATTPWTTATPLSTVGIAVTLGVITLVPALVLACTHFVRFVVVLGFLRTGMGTPSTPPNQVIVGLALFMTLFVSAPLANRIYEVAAAPYLAGSMTALQAVEAASGPLRTFLLTHTAPRQLELFYSMSDQPRPLTVNDVPLRIAIPAFVLSELTAAFRIGLAILLPFLVIDLIAATILTSLGMVMVPPQAIALPLKLLVFTTIDGWHLIVEALLRGAIG